MTVLQCSGDIRSVLGTVLILLYINHLTGIIQHSNYNLYAIDLKFHIFLTYIHDPVALMSSDIDNSTCWATRNGLQLNKSKTILIGNSRLKTSFDIHNPTRIELNVFDLTTQTKLTTLD